MKYYRFKISDERCSSVSIVPALSLNEAWHKIRRVKSFKGKRIQLESVK